MKSNTKCLATGAVVGAIGTLIAGALVGVTVAYTGAYNVAATEDHQPLVRWALGTTIKSSVAGGASTIDPPTQFSAEMVKAGGRAYQTM
ncbi:MAG: hypothetical protein ACI9OO_000068 [Bacteroidia bacterium]|jgi:hypothetical protein